MCIGSILFAYPSYLRVELLDKSVRPITLGRGPLARPQSTSLAANEGKGACCGLKPVLHRLAWRRAGERSGHSRSQHGVLPTAASASYICGEAPGAGGRSRLHMIARSLRSCLVQELHGCRPSQPARAHRRRFRHSEKTTARLRQRLAANRNVCGPECGPQSRGRTRRCNALAPCSAALSQSRYAAWCRCAGRRSA